ncbi:TniQ family protein [Pseudorhizobium sp. NPDC055634]
MLIEVDLHPGENILSYCSRLAAANGVGTLSSMLVQMGTTLNPLWIGAPRAIQSIVDHSTHPEGEIRDACFKPLGRSRYIVRGHNVERRHIRKGTVRYCAACLLDDLECGSGTKKTRPYARLSWLFEDFETCRVHGTVFAERSHGGPLRHDFYNLVSRDLSLVRFDAERAGVREVQPADRYFAGRLDGVTDASQFLDGLPYHVAKIGCELIGLLSSKGAKARLTGFSGADLRDLRRRGFDILADGEAGLEKFLLERIRALPIGYGPQQGSRIFGDLYRYLENHLDEYHRPFVEAVRRVVIGELPYGPQDPFLGRVSEQQVQTLATIATRFGLSKPSVARILEEQGLMPADSKADARSLKFRTADLPIERLDEEGVGPAFNLVLDLYNLRTFVGTSLFDERWPYAIPRSPHRRNYRRRRVTISGTEATLALLTSRAGSPSARDMKMIGEAARFAGCTVNEVLDLLARGALEQVEYRPDLKFLGIRVSISEVRHALDRGEGTEGEPPEP